MNTNASRDSEPAQPTELRRKAEDRLRASAALPAEVTSVTDARALVHELQVHQIELEMQNEELKRARMEAEEASEKYYDLFDFAPAGHFLWDHEGRILEINLAGAALLGLDRSVASQKRFGQFVASEYRGAFADFLKQVLATDLMQTCEVKVQREGSLVWVLIEGIAAQDRQGPERLCRAAVIDITQQKRADELVAANQALEAEIAARKQAEETLRQAKEEWEQTYNTVPDLVAILDDQHRIVRANRAMAERLGVTPEQCVGLRCYEAVHGTTEPPDFCPHAQTCRDGQEHTAEVHEPRLGGHFLVSTTPRFDEQARLIGAVHVARDITQRKRDEEEREIAAGFLRLVNESRGKEDLIRAAATFFQEKSGCEAVGIRLKEDDDYPYYEARGFPQEFLRLENRLCARDDAGQPIRDSAGNPVIECMCGNVICGRFDPSKPFFTARGSFWNNCTTELLASTKEADRQVRTRNRCNGQGYESVALIAVSVGEDRLGLLQLNDRRKGLFSAQSIALWERLAGYLGIALAKTFAEEKVKQSEQQFRTLADSIPNLAWWANGDGYITWYNRQWYEYTGTTPEQMEGWGWQSVHDPDELPRVLERWKATLATGEPFNMEFPLRGRDGQFRWFLTRVLPLKDAEGRVVRWFGTNTDVTEARQARQAAEAANIAKSQFLANISHELRTPMNAILGMVDLALPKQVDPAATDFLKTARDSADLLLALLNDLLDSAKIEAGKLEIESAPFSLHRILDQTAQVLSVRASERGIVFSCRVSSEVPDALVGDQVRLRQVLLNLAGNGIKFTESGEVTVSVRVESQEAETVCLEFAVQDTGIGIPHSDLDNIFRPFTQADSSTTRRFGGTGLGLAICSSLVRMMGGRIWVESEPGHGSTFYFTVRMPLAKELPAEPAARDVLASATSPLRILLVEDNPANQKFAAYVLGERGHTVEIAGDGQQGLSMAQQNHYDVILMDVQMPGMDGLEATAAIRAREGQEKRTPIIAMTAHAMKGDRERCLAADMDDYLSKPIDGHEMIALVESLAAGGAPQPR